jgi:Tfp pilus assembly protein PilN
MPAPLHVDFASPGKGSSRLGLGLAAAGGLAVLAVVAAFQRVQHELSEAEAQASALARRLNAAAQPVFADPAKARALAQRIEASNRVLDALDQPWFKLFEDVESAAAEGVALLALEPDAVQRSVRLAGEASDLDALARYLERLGGLESLGDVRLAQHELRDASAKPVFRFVVSATWRRPA